MGNILSRIKEFSEKENTPIGTIERSIGASKGVLSRAIASGTDVQSKWLEKIVENYPLISVNWLLTGKGEMLQSEYDKNQIPIAHKSQDSKSGIPLIPISAMAGAFTGDMQVLYHECETYDIPCFRDADFLISVKGDSMFPTYRSGDIVACRKLIKDNLFFQWNKVYVLDTDQGALIKRIKPGKDEENIMIVSDNESYDPFNLHISHIYNIALVIGLIRIDG